ncbi:MAG: hypothetical protein K2Q09_10460, partial [Phycisphaerales bacterium]|nr:hypothetical protein [Phycisphaerales bacterium]
QALLALKAAKKVELEKGFSYLKLKGDQPFFPTANRTLGGNILFVRHFYPALFAKLRKTRWAILNGNPGVSKSIFQAYVVSSIPWCFNTFSDLLTLN